MEKNPTLNTEDPAVIAAVAAKAAAAGNSARTIKDAPPAAAPPMSAGSKVFVAVVILCLIIGIGYAGFYGYQWVRRWQTEHALAAASAKLNPAAPVATSSAVPVVPQFSMKLILNNRCISLYEGQSKGFLPTDANCLNDKEFNGYLIRDITNEDPRKLSLFCYGLFQADRAAGLSCSGEQWGQIYNKLSPGTPLPYAVK